jgi:hypothetical protein
MSRRRNVSVLSLAAASILLVACGSRSQLPIDPGPDVDATPPVDEPDALASSCISGSRTIGQTPIALYFTLDKSRSMRAIVTGSTMTRWDAVSAALRTFIDSPLSAGLGAGVAFFPRTTAQGADYCSTADYAFPVVPIGTLPGVAPSILQALKVQTLSLGTPTTPALDGAHVYARSRQVAEPDLTVAVVLVTDGAPRNCNSTVSGTSAVAASAASGTPPIKTYVLGVGPNLANLNAIAQAGGTTQAYLVESAGEQTLLAALEAIRTSALACEYVFPDTGGNPPDFEIARVSTRIGADGPATEVARVANAEACRGGPGWFYDNPVPPANPRPTKVLLCPVSCNYLVQGIGNHLDVDIGCPPLPGTDE